jgi:hypothetical protein
MCLINPFPPLAPAEGVEQALAQEAVVEFPLLGPLVV